MKILNQIIFWYNSTINYFNFKIARKKADKMHKLTGRRYHVIPAPNNKLMVVDNSFVKVYNKKAKEIKTKQIDAMDLIKMSYYSTSLQGVTRK